MKVLTAFLSRDRWPPAHALDTCVSLPTPSPWGAPVLLLSHPVTLGVGTQAREITTQRCPWHVRERDPDKAPWRHPNLCFSRLNLISIYSRQTVHIQNGPRLVLTHREAAVMKKLDHVTEFKFAACASQPISRKQFNPQPYVNTRCWGNMEIPSASSLNFLSRSAAKIR